MAVKARAEIDLVCVVDVASTVWYYKLQSSTLAAPAKPTTDPPGNGWTESEPAYTEGSTNSLYTTMKTVYSNATFAYSTVGLDSSYEAAKVAYNKAKAASDAVGNMTIGGRNIILRADFADAQSSGGNPTVVDGVLTFTGALTTSTSINRKLSEYALINIRNKTITMSMDVMVESNITYGTTNPWIGMELQVIRDSTTDGTTQWLHVLGQKTLSTTATSKWIRYTVSHVVTDYDMVSLSLVFIMRDATGKVKFKNPKIEIGSKMTDFTLAPEDIQDNIDSNAYEFREQITSVSSSIDKKIGEAKTEISQTYITKKDSSDNNTAIYQKISEVAQTAEGLKASITSVKTDGVSKVVTTTGTFDENGLTVDDSSASTKSNLNAKGLEVTDKTGSTNNRLLFAGVENGEAKLDAEFMKIKKYITIGTHSRIQDYGSDRTGVFFIG